MPHKFIKDFSIATKTHSIVGWTHQCFHTTHKLDASWDSAGGHSVLQAEGSAHLLGGRGLRQIPEAP